MADTCLHKCSRIFVTHQKKFNLSRLYNFVFCWKFIKSVLLFEGVGNNFFRGRRFRQVDARNDSARPIARRPKLCNKPINCVRRFVCVLCFGKIAGKNNKTKTNDKYSLRFHKARHLCRTKPKPNQGSCERPPFADGHQPSRIFLRFRCRGCLTGKKCLFCINICEQACSTAAHGVQRLAQGVRWAAQAVRSLAHGRRCPAHGVPGVAQTSHWSARSGREAAQGVGTVAREGR